jgi:hypothetical protein
MLPTMYSLMMISLYLRRQPCQCIEGGNFIGHMVKKGVIAMVESKT